MAATPENARSLSEINPGEIEIGGNPASVTIDLSLKLPPIELIKLVQTIRHSVPQACPVVQFVSAYHGEGTNLIAFETALTAATQLGLRVLFIDTIGDSKTGSRWRRKTERQKLTAGVELPLGALLQSSGLLSRTQVFVAGTNLVYTTLRGPGFEGSTLAILGSFAKLLESFRTTYDLIVIPSAAVNTDALCLALAKVVDGSVLVIEAERTRSPVVRQAQHMIETHGGKILGAILNKRRFHIPHWLYGSL